jgi:polyhydroxyalkanoate synthesis regulator phasin
LYLSKFGFRKWWAGKFLIIPQLVRGFDFSFAGQTRHLNRRYFHGGFTMKMEGEKKVAEAQPTSEEERTRLSKAVGKLLLASIGAVALGQETLDRLLNRMVERGEQVQEAARKRADALREKRRYVIGPKMLKVETGLDAADLPSKADIVSLQDQIAALSTKVDKLSEEKAKRTTQAQP